MALSQAHPVARSGDGGGTGSLDKGIHLLRLVAEKPDDGWHLRELAAAGGMDEPEARRMLDCLLASRMVRQRSDACRYMPGPLMFELGLALPDSARFQRRAEEVLRAVADGRGAIALLVLRSGNDFVCSIREGRAALPPPASARGSRAPLFLSAGGVAILQRLPAGEARAILAENTAREVARRGTGRLAALERMREMSLRCGFGVNAGDVVPGVHSVGMALRDARGQPFAAVCLVGTPASLPLERIDPLRSELEHVAVLLSGEARQFHM